MCRISLIVLNYNGESIILDCLKSIDVQGFKKIELIIVDNNSKDNSIDLIEQFKKQASFKIKTLYLKENLGFTGGNIEGLKHATGDYIALLNNDTEADAFWLKNLIKAMDEHPEAGICASKMVVYGTDTIDSAGDMFSKFLKGFKRGEGEDTGKYNTEEYVFGACAGAALYRRKMIDEIGFLDSDFFLIHEDTDFNLRAQLMGWKVLYVPTAIVYHKVRSSIGHMSDTAVYYTLRNNEFVRIKNIPLSLFVRCFPTFVLGEIMEFFYFVVKHRHPWLYLKAKLDALKMLPAMLRKRKAIMKARSTSYSDLMVVMTPAFDRNFFKAKFKKFING